MAAHTSKNNFLTNVTDRVHLQIIAGLGILIGVSFLTGMVLGLTRISLEASLICVVIIFGAWAAIIILSILKEPKIH